MTDPAEAAQWAAAAAEGAEATDGAVSESVPSFGGETEPESPSKLGSIIEGAWNTEPEMKLDDPRLESLWNPEKGGLTRVHRGVKKWLGFDGLPAWLDVGIGLGETWVNRSELAASGGSGGSESSDSKGELPVAADHFEGVADE